MSYIPSNNESQRNLLADGSLTSSASNDPASEVMAAVARSATRGLALYFSRPVRLFRPAKVTGWQFLRNIASQEGASLTPNYVLTMCKTQGVWVVPKHFLPPILLNAALGTVLWTSYGLANEAITERFGDDHPIRTAALAGGFAGGCQALVAAPAENVRLLLEGGSGGHSWSCVWKEVFRSRVSPPSLSHHQQLQEIRELRHWLHEVGEMAGRGWDGWKWGCGKDICAFAAFFTVFEMTRRTSASITPKAHEFLSHPAFPWDPSKVQSAPKVINACTLVAGGVLAGLVYEAVSRPWDRVRRIVHVHECDPTTQKKTIPSIIQKAIREDGAPVFHEGLKSWSCCKDVNKPVLDFEEFMAIPGCTETDGHTSEAFTSQPAPSAAQQQKQAAASTPVPISTIQEGGDNKETFTIGAPATLSAATTAVAPPPPIVEDEDDLDAPVEPGTHCKRRGCGVTFVSDEVNRKGDGEGTVCVYHPLPPLFREGSKGYLCCKPKVLEFEEFLKIKGCKTGRHCFVPKAKDTKTEELVQCRIDHYQTVDKVQVSVFAKKVDKTESTVKFEEDKVLLDMRLPDNKRFKKTIELFGPIEPEKSSFIVLGTKVELSLQKKDGRSWTVLEKTDRDLGGISLTFGVTGRTGTVGAKEVILDATNRARSEGL
ncbi:hypothetical protein CC2G_005785 [Coprinopsis cinerea AmutBmut pab1-1]|nr:hypothetical protein CC2G_005785 [Coprinopsis cinerea AmutBmut pab1-1]